MSRVLILDGMWNKSLAAVRSLGKRGLYVAAGERTRLATALFSRYCKKRVIYPSPVEQKQEFLHYLEDELAQGDYDVTLPMEFSTQIILTDRENKQKLERYTRIPFADAGLAMNVNDKAFIMQHALGKGFHIPKTYFLNREDQIAEVAKNVEYPIVIKPRVSSGSRGIVYAKSREELISSYKQVHRRYPFPFVQEYIPDGEGTYGVGLLLNFNSEIRASFVYKRLRCYPVSGGPSTLRESVKREDIQGIAESLLQSLKWTGIAHVEFKIDPRDNLPKLLEVNPRFWGSLQLAIEAGVDFPYLLYRMAMDRDVEPVKDYKSGVRCRWLIPGDILHFIKNPERFKLKPSFFDLHIRDDIVSRNDLMPTFGRFLSAFVFLFDKEMRKLITR